MIKNKLFLLSAIAISLSLGVAYQAESAAGGPSAREVRRRLEKELRKEQKRRGDQLDIKRILAQAEMVSALPEDDYERFVGSWQEQIAGLTVGMTLARTQRKAEGLKRGAEAAARKKGKNGPALNPDQAAEETKRKQEAADRAYAELMGE